MEAALNGILNRRWYTNHGPLARLLEAEWADATGRKHAIAVVNPTIGLIMMAEALALSGEVALSALAPPRCVQALSWAGLTPRFCDVDPDTLGLDLAATSGVAAVLATPGAGAAAIRTVSAPVFGDGIDRLPGPTLTDLPGHGDDAGAGMILTDDDQLAARLRNIRSSYGAGPPVPVVRTANGRLSEAQAAAALLVRAGHSFQSLALDACAELCPGHRLLPYGRRVLVIGESVRDRDALRHALSEAGLQNELLSLDSRAANCTEAASVIERAFAVQPRLQLGAAV